MKVICTKKDLSKGLDFVQLAVSAKSTIPALNNFLMETTKDKIMLVATDLEIGIRCYIEGKIEEPGAITIPAKKLAEIVRELPDKDIKISVSEKNTISVICEKTRLKLPGIPKEEFPVLPEVKESKSITIPIKSLKEMILKTNFAISTDETRYVLNGIYMITSNKSIKMVATDGRRLAYINRDIKTEGTIPNTNIIIPNKAIQSLLQLINSTEEEDIKINIGSNQIAYTLGDSLFITRLIEGDYPNYEQVIPKNTSIKVKINTKAFLQVTKRMHIFATDSSISMKLGISNKLLKIAINASTVGEAEDEIETDYEGESLDIAFNPQFVLEILRVTESEEIILELGGALTPGIIRPMDDKEYLCVIMPMRLQ